MDENNFHFDFSKPGKESNMIQIVGIGEDGCRIVKKLSSKDIDNVNFAAIGDSNSTRSMPDIVDIYCVDGNDPQLDTKTASMIGDMTHLLVVIARLDNDNAVPIASSLCRHIRPFNEETSHHVSIVMAILSSDDGNAAKIDAIREHATSVIPFEDNPINNSKVEEYVCEAADTILCLNSSYIDYNDFATLFQLTHTVNAVRSVGEGESRAKMAATRQIESIRHLVEHPQNIRYILLLIRCSPSNVLKMEELDDIFSSLQEGLNEDIGFLWGLYEDSRCENTQLILNAFVTI